MIVLAFVFHPSANVGAWGAIILALICTFTPKINLARLCPTHHWMYDAGLYSMKAIRLLKAHWKAWYKKGGIPDHTAQMKDAGPKAARKRKHRAAGRKAAETRLLRAKSKISQS